MIGSSQNNISSINRRQGWGVLGAGTAPIAFIIPIALWCGMVNDHLRTNWYYVTCSIGVTCIVFFYNFPFFTKWMHTRPVYFEDLFDEDAEPFSQDTYQRWFMAAMNLFLTIIICMLFNYAIYQSHDIEITPLRIITIIGSLCGLHAKVQSNVGSALMVILHHRKKHTQKRRLSATNSPIKSNPERNIQLTEFSLA